MLSTLVVFIGIVNLFAGLAIIFLVLMQQGKGAAVARKDYLVLRVLPIF